jgi:hypothetical protein
MHGNQQAAFGVRYSCAVCGSHHGVALKRYSRTYTPPWVYFTILFGVIPVAIISLVVSTKHLLAVPFCTRCGRRHDLMQVVILSAVIGVLSALIVGGAYAAGQEWWAPFGAAILLAGVIIAAAARFVRNAQPHYLKFDANNVVIHDVVHGPVVLFARQRAYYPAH